MANICDYIRESINEGEYLRDVIYISGCKHFCPSCFSSQTWDFDYGVPFTPQIQNKVIENVKNNILIKGITICGGDSFYSAKDMIDFVKKFKDELPGKTIWAYTGFSYEDIVASDDKYMMEYLSLIDVLIDGKFLEDKRDLTLKYKGSSNQRVINVKESLRQKKVVLLDI